jgi:hypothetical protein
MSAEIYQFEDFELDRGAYQLRRDGRVVHLERIRWTCFFCWSNAMASSSPARKYWTASGAKRSSLT